ncbi:hypothetical protein [Pectobacterium aquaticum]|uniref:hypothetical protein n=1 Tax=Pectobacterium aquaticum TaxID=2204145 RepID=UPI000E230A9C|nr:hypothetical protein [Pectobacterium aquaticum]RRN97145.1 hypothetical protein DMB79_009715 [Pectobacterium aquaticum]
MTKINELIKQMGELAEEILELQAEGRGGSDLIHLYDRADSVFSAENVKALLQNNDALIATIEMQDQKIQKLEVRSISLPRLPVLGSNTEWYQGFAAGARSMRKDCIGAINAAGIRAK